MAAVGMRRPVHFMASDYIFRKPALAFLLRLLGAVPKAKFRSDMGSLKALIQAKKCGAVVGIFPEGHVNWSGRTREIVPSTGKLVRLLDAPVLVVKIRGGYISRPRWRQGSYAPGQEFTYSTIISRQELKEMSHLEVNQRIQEALKHDEWEYLRKHPRNIRRKNRAEGLERVLFKCPDCGSYASLSSSRNTLSCQACGKRLNVDEGGFFTEHSFQHVFPDVAHWDSWQQEALAQDIAEVDPEDVSPLFSDALKCLSRWEKGRRFFPVHGTQGRIAFFPDRLEINGVKNITIQIREISGLTVQNSEEIEFYIGNILHRLDFEDRFLCAYKWYSAISTAQQQLTLQG